MTQRELADVIGVSSSEVVSRWERGEREPRLDMLFAIAEALQISPGQLIDLAYGSAPAQSDMIELRLSDDVAGRWRGSRQAPPADLPGFHLTRVANPTTPPLSASASRGASVEALLRRFEVGSETAVAAACRIALLALDELEEAERSSSR